MAEILIIEDNPQLRSTMVRALATIGHRVYDAANGAAGIKLFHDVRPALVITDIVMPEQEGIETIRLLRQQAADLPILAISGGGWMDYLSFARALGATATLEKPFGTDQLLSTVAELLADKPRSGP